MIPFSNSNLSCHTIFKTGIFRIEFNKNKLKNSIMKQNK